jgi:hypothetical protein
LGVLVAKRPLEISNGNQKFGVGCQMATRITAIKHKNRYFKAMYQFKNRKFRALRAHILIYTLIFGCQAPNLGLIYNIVCLVMPTLNKPNFIVTSGKIVPFLR